MIASSVINTHTACLFQLAGTWCSRRWNQSASQIKKVRHHSVMYDVIMRSSPFSAGASEKARQPLCTSHARHLDMAGFVTKLFGGGTPQVATPAPPVEQPFLGFSKSTCDVQVLLCLQRIKVRTRKTEADIGACRNEVKAMLERNNNEGAYFRVEAVLRESQTLKASS